MTFIHSRVLFPGAASLALLAACGGTVELTNETMTGAGGTAGSSAGGQAGSGGSGKGGAAGAGGTGGAAGSGGVAGQAGMGGGFDCQALMQVGPTIEIAGETYKSQFNPLLSLASKDGKQVALAVMEQMNEGPSIPPVELHVGALAAWSPWPTGPLPMSDMAPFVVGPDLVRIARGAGDGQLAVAYPGTPSPPASEPTTVFYNPAVSAVSATSAIDNNALQSSGKTQRAMFVTRGIDNFLIGHEDGNETVRTLQLSMSAGTNPAFTLTSNVGCGGMPLVADAVASGGGYIFGFSSSQPFGACSDPSGGAGNPDRVLLGFTGGPGGGFGALPWSAAMSSDAVRFLRMTSSTDDGAWIAYAFEGMTAEVQPPLMLARVDASGNEVVASIPIIDGPQIMTPPALTNLRGNPVVAHVPAGGPGPMAMLNVSVYSATGSVQASAQLAAKDQMTGEVAVIAHPVEPEIIVAWSEFWTMQQKVYLAKFACALPD